MTILGNVLIILVDLKIILSDFPEVWGVLRVTESAPIRNPAVWGGHRGQKHVQSADYHVKRIYIQSESELTRTEA